MVLFLKGRCLEKQERGNGTKHHSVTGLKNKNGKINNLIIQGLIKVEQKHQDISIQFTTPRCGSITQLSLVIFMTN